MFLSGDRVAFTQYLVAFGLSNVWIFSCNTTSRKQYTESGGLIPVTAAGDSQQIELNAAVQRKEEIMGCPMFCSVFL